VPKTKRRETTTLGTKRAALFELFACRSRLVLEAAEDRFGSPTVCRVAPCVSVRKTTFSGASQKLDVRRAQA
jgi:hypothetical protein